MHIVFVVIVFLLSISTLLINLYELLRNRDSSHLISQSDKNILYVNVVSSSIITLITGIMLIYRHAQYNDDSGGSGSGSGSGKPEYIVENSGFGFG
jgi:uncharacterized membrane protein